MSCVLYSFTLLFGTMMMRQKKAAAAGLAKDDEDVRVQSTNDEATGARACVFFLLCVFGFLPIIIIIIIKY